MVLAASSAQVVTNLPDDEGDMVNRRGAEIGLGTVRDNLAFHDRHRLCDERAIFADLGQMLGISARRHHVELDPPQATAFTEIEGAAVDRPFPLLRRVRGGPPGINTCLAGKPRGDCVLLALRTRAQLRRLGTVPPCLPASRLGSAAVLVPGAPAVEAIAMVRRKPRMTGAPALIAVSIAGIEQRCYDPARCSPVHLGAGHEVARVMVGQSATLSFALRLAARALLLTATEVDDVKVSHAGKRTLRASVKHLIFGRASSLLRRPIPRRAALARWRVSQRAGEYRVHHVVEKCPGIDGNHAGSAQVGLISGQEAAQVFASVPMRPQLLSWRASIRASMVGSSISSRNI